jgi:hypothetical protein
MLGVSAPKENPAAYHGDYDVAPKFKTTGLKNMGNMSMDLFAENMRGASSPTICTSIKSRLVKLHQAALERGTSPLTFDDQNRSWP